MIGQLFVVVARLLTLFRKWIGQGSYQYVAITLSAWDFLYKLPPDPFTNPFPLTLVPSKDPPQNQPGKMSNPFSGRLRWQLLTFFFEKNSIFQFSKVQPYLISIGLAHHYFGIFT